MINMQAVLYLRVSTERPQLENQLEPLTTFAKKRALKVVQVYRDMAPGRNSSRPALNQILKDANQHAFDVQLHVHRKSISNSQEGSEKRDVFWCAEEV